MLYCNENPADKVGLSKFCNLRPRNVLLLKDTLSDQGRCNIHEKFFMKLQALQKTYDSNFWSNFLCDVSPNSECWLSHCDKCKEYTQGNEIEDFHLKTTLKQWKTVPVPQSSSNRSEPSKEEVNVENYLTFLVHFYLRNSLHKEHALSNAT